MNLVVFSKDRPAQLDLLLRSVSRFCTDAADYGLSVLYAASDAEFERGYARVRELHPDVSLVREVDFRAQTVELVDPARGLTSFLVDDDVFRAPFSLAAREVQVLRDRPDVACVSLRLGPEIDRCYTQDCAAPAPALRDGVWAWHGLPGDWGYPMSLDGHVFRTAQIRPLLERLPFSSPNSLEAALAATPLPLPHAVCFPEARLVNVPANRVQDEFPNRAGSASPADLNARFLAGERISLAPIVRERNRAPHHEVAYEWEPQAPELTIGLLVIATDDYVPFAERMIESARKHFLVGHRLVPLLFGEDELRGRVGFPAATLYRYHVFTEQRERLAECDYVFYCDADMLFVDEVGDEVLGRITATRHPGFLSGRGTYEDRPESAAYVTPHEGVHYYCGGFNGGRRDDFLALSETIVRRIDADDANGIVAVWHDESHLNRYLVDDPPEVVLTPSYCYPEVVHPHYVQTWPEAYRPRLVALDKTLGAFRLERNADRRPKVSIVIPCWNQAHFLAEAVASAVEQTLRSLEIVIVDDGSPDETAAVAERLAAQYPGREIRLVRKQNGGLPSARNAGIAAARGDYILPLDADDLLTPGFAAECARVLDSHPEVSIAYGGQQNFGEDAAFHPHPEYDFHTLTRANILGVASMFRRAAWEEVGGYDEGLDSYEDWDFWIACGERGHFGRLVPSAAFLYRVRAGSMFAGATERDQRLKAQIVTSHPRLYTAAQVAWAQGVLAGDPGALAVDGPLYQVPELDSGAQPVALEGARGFAVLALAEDVLARPSLLTEYGSFFGAGDDATLVVYGPGWTDEALVEQLVPVLSAAGLDGEDSPDMLAVALPPGSERGLARSVQAVVSSRPLDLDRALPHFDAGSLARLRLLAGAR